MTNRTPEPSDRYQAIVLGFFEGNDTPTKQFELVSDSYIFNLLDAIFYGEDGLDHLYTIFIFRNSELLNTMEKVSPEAARETFDRLFNDYG